MNGGALISFGFAAFFQVIALLLTLEGWLLATNREPITFYVRRAEWAFPGPALIVVVGLAAIVGALFSHFVWDAGKDKTPPIDQPK
jgi:uncharacterized integral membrane protein